MVVILSVALRLPTGTEHERFSSPLMCTVHAPHCATPQPYFVPVSPACSRIAQSSGCSGSTSRSTVFPLMFNFMVTPPAVIYEATLDDFNRRVRRDEVEQLDDFFIPHPDAAQRSRLAPLGHPMRAVDIDVTPHRIDVAQAVLPRLLAG